MVALNGTVRLVALQFRFTNPEVIPALIKKRQRETPQEYSARKSHSSGISGIKVIEQSTNHYSLGKLLVDLEASGYELVDALYQERPTNQRKDPKGKWTYHMVRFLFARREFVELSDEFKKVRDVILTELRSITERAFWCAEVYSNPFCQGGQEVVGQRAVSVNLTGRQPLFCPDGQPVTVWQKDENGGRVGDTPLPLKADYCLRIVADAVSIMTA